MWPRGRLPFGFLASQRYAVSGLVSVCPVVSLRHHDFPYVAWRASALCFHYVTAIFRVWLRGRLPCSFIAPLRSSVRGLGSTSVLASLRRNSFPRVAQRASTLWLRCATTFVCQQTASRAAALWFRCVAAICRMWPRGRLPFGLIAPPRFPVCGLVGACPLVSLRHRNFPYVTS